MIAVLAAGVLVGTPRAVAQAQGGGGAGGGQLVPKPTMLEMIWEDAFGSSFVEGLQFLILTEPDAEEASDVWMAEIDPETGADSATLRGDMLDAQLFPVEWYDTLEMPLDCTVDGDPVLADVTVVMDAVAGRLVTDQGYDKWVTGLALRVHVEMVLPDTGESAELLCFLPLARHADQASAAQYAWEYSLLEPPYPETLSEEDCWETFMEERDKAWTDFFSERDNCDAWDVLDGVQDGAVSGGVAGGILGSVIPGLGTKIGAVIGLVGGGIAGGITGYQSCIDEVKQRYRQRYNRHWNCYQLCVQNGDGMWPCARD